MIIKRDLWQLEFISNTIDRMIRTNDKASNNRAAEDLDYSQGINFGMNIVNGDLIKIKKRLDEQIELLNNKAESSYMIDDLTFEEVESE
ncbi:hypothetical protein [Mesobacillus zeae]|uniref:Uncharacterized protein n=1 Tax=Mesobacillus zeae TaxID=1917180 RepID=A0A398BDG8_9BACI|nr:hypothetical protein [Mesobacillus zeae]RID85633.1 hypothetical protein D1970_08745 [Mesobacillus zeae]